jgi:hypothetical protein
MGWRPRSRKCSNFWTLRLHKLSQRERPCLRLWLNLRYGALTCLVVVFCRLLSYTVRDGQGRLQLADKALMLIDWSLWCPLLPPHPYY